jgi:uncharacterized protein YndB with AHSA1/START domain
MHSISTSRVVDAPVARVWAVLDDFGGVSNYNPMVDDSRTLGERATGAGARRECLLDGGGRLEEVIVDYEDGRGYTVEFVDAGPYPMASNVVEFAVRPVADDRTEVSISSEFTPKYGPLGWLAAKLLVERRVRETYDEVLAGLDEHLRTGAPVDGAAD